MHQAINPPGFPPNPAYSQGMLTTGTRTLYVSGQVGIGPDGKPGDGIAAQAQAAIANMGAVLATAGMGPADIVKLTIYLTDASLIPGFIEAASSSLTATPPATTLLVVKALAMPELLIEVECVAVQ